MKKPNFSIWYQAVVGMPRLDAEQWQQLDLPGRWLVASRASVLIMTFTAAAIGGMLAAREHLFQPWLWGLAVIGLLFAHATNNLLNDYTDYVRGVDTEDYFRNRYGTHVLAQGLLDKRQFFAYIAITAALALLSGSAILLLRGGLTLPLLVAGATLVIFYTWPLKAIGLGEPSVLLAWGPLMVGGTYYVVTGHWDWLVALTGTAYALGPCSVVFGKHIDKATADAAKQVYTLPVLLGAAKSRQCVIALLVIQYCLLFGLVVAAYLSAWVLLVVFNLPVLMTLVKTYCQPMPGARPDSFPVAAWPLWFSAFAFDHTRRFSILLLLGLLLDCLLG